MKVVCLGSVGVSQYHNHLTLANVTVDSQEGADIHHDLNVYPYPFSDNEFDKVFASHILEHLDEPQKALTEMLRIGRLVEVYVPHRYSKVAKSGIGHKNVFSTTWFKKALKALPVVYSMEVLWDLPLSLRPREIHLVILKRGNIR